MVDFGNILKTLRLQNHLTQAQLAQKLGLTKSVISAYETGLRMPSYDILIATSKIFNVTTDYLLGLERKQEIDLSGLTDEEITALLNLIKNGILSNKPLLQRPNKVSYADALRIIKNCKTLFMLPLFVTL